MSKEQKAPRQASDKKTDLKQYRAQVMQLDEEMREHTYSFTLTNYRDYIIAFNKEREFWVRAQKLGRAGVDTYRYRFDTGIQQREEAAVAKAKHEVATFWQGRVQKLREQYMQPIDYYREKLANFDWTHPMSDSMNVWSSGADRQQKLIDEAIAGGEEFKQAFKEAYEKGWSYGNPGTVWDWDKYELLKKAVRK